MSGPSEAFVQLFLGFGLILAGAGMVWVRYAHERHDPLAEAIFSIYEKAQFTKIPMDPYFLFGGIGLIVLGALFLAGWIG